MGMQAIFFFVKDNRSGLAFQTELLFDPVNRVFEYLDGDGFALRRVDGNREEILLALRAKADRFGFLEGVIQIVGGKALDLMHAHMLVVVHLHEMSGEVRAGAALRSLDNHWLRSACLPSALINRQRISRTSCRHVRRNSSVSGVIGNEPILAACAS